MIHPETPNMTPVAEVRMGKFNVEQADGAIWSVYHDKDNPDRYFILTSAGRDRMIHDPEFRDLIGAYRDAELGLPDTDPEMRKKLGSGQEATVNKMGNYAVREEEGVKGMYKALGELDRMDALSSLIEGGMPRWLDLPAHYAVYSDPTTNRTYTVMDRINGGLTVEDVESYPELPPERAKVVESELGSDIEGAKTLISDLYVQAYDVLAGAIKKKNQDPARYLTDWKPRNVLVEKVSTPLAGSPFTLDVIDQYRA